MQSKSFLRWAIFFISIYFCKSFNLVEKLHDDNKASDQLSNLVKGLNEGIQPYSNAYLIAPSLLNTLEKAMQSNVPNIAACEIPAPNWLLNYNTKVLLIISLEKTAADLAYIFNEIVHTKKLEHLDVLFILDGTVSPEENYLSLFQMCWQKGVGHVLLTDTMGNMLSYDPFPEVHVTNVTVEEYLESRIWRDLKGYKVKLLLTYDPPLSYTVNGRWVGTIVDAVNYTMAFFNGSVVASTDTDDSCLEMKGAIEMCSNFDHVGDRELSDFVQVFGIPLAVMVRTAPPLPTSQYFLAPFATESWLLLIGGCFYVASALSLVHRIQRGHWNWGRYIVAAVNFPINLWVDVKQLRGRSKPFVSILLFATGFILSSVYLARMSIIQRLRLRQKEINTLDDLIESDVRIKVSEYYKQYLTKYKVSERLLNKMDIEVYDDIGAFLDLDPAFAYVRKLSITQFLMARQEHMSNPTMKVLPEPLLIQIVGIPTRHRYPLNRFFQRNFQDLWRTGIFHIMLKRYLGAFAETLPLNMTTEYIDELRPLNVEYFYVPFTLLASGLLLACVAFLFELIETRKLNKFAIASQRKLV